MLMSLLFQVEVFLLIMAIFVMIRAILRILTVFTLKRGRLIESENELTVFSLSLAYIIMILICGLV